LGVNDGESTAVVQDFVNEYRITFPILLDLDSRVSWKYAVNAYPTTYFIDQEGNVQAIHLGLLSESTLATQLGKVGIQ
jgi:peroxiredoxin